MSGQVSSPKSCWKCTVSGPSLEILHTNVHFRKNLMVMYMLSRFNEHCPRTGTAKLIPTSETIYPCAVPSKAGLHLCSAENDLHCQPSASNRKPMTVFEAPALADIFQRAYHCQPRFTAYLRKRMAA